MAMQRPPAASAATPIACSLSAPDYAERLDLIQEVARRGLLRVQGSPGVPELVFRADPEIRVALERVIEAEARCCPFLSITLRSEGSEVVVRIEAPEAAAPVVRDLVDRAGRVDGPRSSGRWLG